MADASVNSAALDRLSASLEGQTIALKALTESNQRAILQKDETVNIKGVQTRGGGTRPYDEVTASAVAAGNQPLVDALKKDQEPGLLSKLLKGVLVGGAAFLIYNAITGNSALKKIFDKGVSAVKNFLVGENGILTRAYDFLFKDGQGEDAGIIRRMVRTMSELFPEGSLLDNIATSVEGALQSIGTFVEGIPFILPMIESTFSDLRTEVDNFVDKQFKALQETKPYKEVMRIYNNIFGPQGAVTTLPQKVNDLISQIENSNFYKKLIFYFDDIKKGKNSELFKNAKDGIDDMFESLFKSIQTVVLEPMRIWYEKTILLPLFTNINKLLDSPLLFGKGDKYKIDTSALGLPSDHDLKVDRKEFQNRLVDPLIPDKLLDFLKDKTSNNNEDVVEELSNGKMVQGINSLGEKMDRVADALLNNPSGPGVVTVPGAEGPGTNYNGVFEQRSLVR